MSLKEKIKELKDKLHLQQKMRQLGVTAALAAVSVVPKPNIQQQPLSDINNPFLSSIKQDLDKFNRLTSMDEIKLGIDDFLDILKDNPNIKLSKDILNSIQPGKSHEKVKNMVKRSFNFTVKNSYGIQKNATCSFYSSPKGYCLGALKQIMNKAYKLKKSNNLSAYQEKDSLIKSGLFLPIPIKLEDVKNCPPSSIVVIPQCKGHKHGHIFYVVEKGEFCSDGKETFNDKFVRNYSSAQGIYAFIPKENTITFNKNSLYDNQELFAAVLDKLDEKAAKDNPQNRHILLSQKDGKSPLIYGQYMDMKKQNSSRS